MITYYFILNILQTFTTSTMSLAPSNARSSRTSDLRAWGWMGQEVVARTSPRSKLQVLEMVLITIREVGMDGKSFSNLVLLLCQVHQVPPTIFSSLTRKCFLSILKFRNEATSQDQKLTGAARSPWWRLRSRCHRSWLRGQRERHLATVGECCRARLELPCSNNGHMDLWLLKIKL